MKLHRLLLPFAVLSLCACAGHGNEDAPTSGGGKAESKNVTDLKSCQGQAPADATLIGPWHDEWKSGISEMTDQFEFANNGTLQLSVECRFNDGTSLHATREGRYELHDKQFVVTKGGENSVSGGGANVIDTCAVTIPEMTFDYEFVGNCLKITNALNKGQTSTLIR